MTLLCRPSTICRSNSCSIFSRVTAFEAEPVPDHLVCPEANPSPTPTPTPTLKADHNMLFCSIQQPTLMPNRGNDLLARKQNDRETGDLCDEQSLLCVRKKKESKSSENCQSLLILVFLLLLFLIIFIDFL